MKSLTEALHSTSDTMFLSELQLLQAHIHKMSYSSRLASDQIKSPDVGGVGVPRGWTADSDLSVVMAVRTGVVQCELQAPDSLATQRFGGFEKSYEPRRLLVGSASLISDVSSADFKATLYYTSSVENLYHIQTNSTRMRCKSPQGSVKCTSG